MAQPVREFDDSLRTFVADLVETMYAAPGVGLAATQVDVHRQVIATDVSENRNDLRVFVNPVIVSGTGESTLEEGCLSVPGIYDKVPRHDSVRVKAQDVFGNTFEFEAGGLLSVCIQHEMDHLKGRVFVEYLSRLKQNRIAAKLRKQQRQTG